MHKLFRVGVGLALGSIVALGGCVVEPTGAYYGGYYTSGYAPYGERYVTPDGYTVVYDSGPGAYTVAGVPGLYWWGGYYYRRHGDYWERSHHYRGPWVYRSAESVPFVAHRGGYGHSSGGVRAQATDSAPGRYGNRGWAANQAGTVQRYDQFPAAQNQRYQQRSTTYPTWDAARRAQNQNQNQNQNATCQADTRRASCRRTLRRDKRDNNPTGALCGRKTCRAAERLLPTGVPYAGGGRVVRRIRRGSNRHGVTRSPRINTATGLGRCRRTPRAGRRSTHRGGSDRSARPGRGASGKAVLNGE